MDENNVKVITTFDNTGFTYGMKAEYKGLVYDVDNVDFDEFP